ncbi:MAG: hypothetical protein LBU15_01655 [Rickettsiales bacterium]|jgi:XTP/dITP diphosphohydrolase|nr:hypothetical protein [Rickettsiales bacterium]
MTHGETVFLASANENKVKEISLLLGTLGIGLKSLVDFNLESPEETGETFRENALLKARFGFEKTKLTTLADDSGFCLEALDNFPGIFSGRFAQERGGFENAARLLHRIVGDGSKKAHFTTTVAIIYRNAVGKLEERVFDGTVEGQLCYPPRGSNGFGYCSCFMPSGSSVSYGEMEDRLRIRTNHRAQAFGKLLEFLGDRSNFFHHPS